VSEWVSEWMSEWVSECMHARTYAPTHATNTTYNAYGTYTAYIHAVAVIVVNEDYGRFTLLIIKSFGYSTPYSTAYVSLASACTNQNALASNWRFFYSILKRRIDDTAMCFTVSIAPKIVENVLTFSICDWYVTS